MPDEVNRALGLEGGGFPVIVRNDDGAEQTWVLSDCSIAMAARHTAYIKGRLRHEKLTQKAEGVIDDETLKRELRQLDHDFACGLYVLGEPLWQDACKSIDTIARLYQILLEEHQPEVARWSVGEIDDLVNKNPDGFAAALGDILPKVMAELKRIRRATR